MSLDTGARLLGVRQEQGERGLVGDKGLHVAGVVGDQGESRDCATAAAEHVGGPVANGLEHPAHVVGEQVRLRILVRAVDLAAAEAPRVGGHDGIVLGEQWRDRGESRSTHGVPDQHERRARALYLVVQASSRNNQRVTRRRRHAHATPRPAFWGREPNATEARPRSP